MELQELNVEKVPLGDYAICMDIYSETFPS